MSSQNKTQPTNASVSAFIEQVPQAQKKSDSLILLEIFQRITGEKPVIWGDSIIGFGSYHYKYASGREGDFLRSGFSPRKANISIYLMLGFSKRQTLLAALGKHKTSVSCLYINKLADIDLAVLEQLIQANLNEMNEKYPS